MNTFKTLRIVHLAVLAEAIVFLGVVLFFKQEKVILWINEENPSMYLIGLLVIIGAAMSAFIVPRMLLDGVRSKPSKPERLKAYIPVAIIRMALMDAAMTMCIVFFYIDEAWIYILVFSLLMLVFIGMVPTQLRIEHETETNIDDFTGDEFDD